MTRANSSQKELLTDLLSCIRPFIYVTHFHQKRCYVRDVFSALF